MKKKELVITDTKSFRRCPTKCYLENRDPDVGVEFYRKVDHQQILLACKEFFPEGQWIDSEDPNAIQTTQLAIENGTCLLNGTLSYQNKLQVPIDILEKKGNHWILYGIQANKYGERAAIAQLQQIAYCIQIHPIPCKIQELRLISINTEYTLKKTKAESPEQLLEIQTIPLSQRKRYTEDYDAMIDTLAQKQAPSPSLGKHCFKPEKCPYLESCFPDLKKPSIFNITGLNLDTKLQEFKNKKGSLKALKIGLTATQKELLNMYQTQTPIIKQNKIIQFINTLSYPLSFLDFEAFQSAIPIVEEALPYEHIPFQYSLHIIKKENRRPKHKHFLNKKKKAPHLPLLKSLLKHLPKTGSIIAFDKQFEKQTLTLLSKIYPKYTERIEDIINRIIDIKRVFEDHYLYTPEMRGQYSLKKMAESLLPQLSYQNLSIEHGEMAAHLYKKTRLHQKHPNRKEIYRDLEAYCSQDTYVLVELFKIILHVSRTGSLK